MAKEQQVARIVERLHAFSANNDSGAVLSIEAGRGGLPLDGIVVAALIKHVDLIACADVVTNGRLKPLLIAKAKARRFLWLVFLGAATVL